MIDAEMLTKDIFIKCETIIRECIHLIESLNNYNVNQMKMEDLKKSHGSLLQMRVDIFDARVAVFNRMHEISGDVDRCFEDSMFCNSNPTLVELKRYNDLLEDICEGIKEKQSLIEKRIEETNLKQNVRAREVYDSSCENDNNILNDHVIKSAITTAETTSFDPMKMILMIPFSIFAAFLLGSIVCAIVEWICYDLISIFPYEVDVFVSQAFGFAAGVGLIVLILTSGKRRADKIVQFAEKEYKNSILFQSEGIKVVQETPTSYYIHFKDEKGKARISKIRQEACDKDIKDVYVLKYPKYSGGYGYLAFDVDGFENTSSIQLKEL